MVRWLMAVGVWAAGTLLHDVGQGGCRWLAERWGADTLSSRAGVVGVGALVLTVGVAFVGTLRHGGVALRAWVGWGGMTALAWAVLVQLRTEGVHFPQYALIAWLFWRAGSSPTWALAISCGLGMVDEAWQAYVLYGRAMDWNDVVLDALGAALGLLLVWSWEGLGFWAIGAEGVVYHPLSWWEGLLCVAAVVAGFHHGVVRAPIPSERPPPSSPDRPG